MSPSRLWIELFSDETSELRLQPPILTEEFNDELSDLRKTDLRTATERRESSGRPSHKFNIDETRPLRIIPRNRSRKLLPSWFSRSLVTNVRDCSDRSPG